VNLNLERTRELGRKDAGSQSSRLGYSSKIFDPALPPEIYSQLARNFPRTDLFADAPGYRPDGQRQHRRRLLRLKYRLGQKTLPGLVGLKDLSPGWSEFIRSLKSRRSTYRRFLEGLLGTQWFDLHFEWHRSDAGSDIPPHKDASWRRATHLFYFPDQNGWQENWGGQTVLLRGQKNEILNPEFEDFEEVTSIPFKANTSMLFLNSNDAWHGVKPVTCPEGVERKILMVTAIPYTLKVERMFLGWKKRK